ncbi:uncharacterized protein LOC144347854 [Saccoglossus kowalevskii]
MAKKITRSTKNRRTMSLKRRVVEGEKLMLNENVKLKHKWTAEVSFPWKLVNSIWSVLQGTVKLIKNIGKTKHVKRRKRCIHFLDKKMEFLLTNKSKTAMTSSTKKVNTSTERYWYDHNLVISETGEAVKNGIHGPQYLFDVWLQLMARWFDTEGVRVYLVSPFLDEEILQDICTVISTCGNGKKGVLERFFIRENCYNNIKISNIVKTGLNADEKKIFKRCISRALHVSINKTYFHCKFLAGVYPSGVVELMVTSANFTRTHLGATYRQLDSLELKKTSRRHFENNYILPLEKSTVCVQ